MQIRKEKKISKVYARFEKMTEVFRFDLSPKLCKPCHQFILMIQSKVPYLAHAMLTNKKVHQLYIEGLSNSLR